MPEPDRPVTWTMRLCRALLRLGGWRVVVDTPPGDKYVVVAAWHTSNWDFPLAVVTAGAMGLPLHFIGKKELVDGRLGWLMTRLGVIGVDRSRRTRFVDRVAEEFRRRDTFHLVVPAEGTRGPTEYWRTGFYYMALAADVPIAFGVVDVATRTVGIDGWFRPSGDRDADLERVRAYYADKRGLKAHNMGPIRFTPPREAPDGTPEERLEPR